MAVEPTKSTTLTGVYQRLCTLYGADNTTRIPVGSVSANKVLLTVLTKAVDIAWGETAPAIAGHQIAVGDSYTLNGMDVIGLAWLRNTVVADTATVIITAFQEFA